MLAVEEAPRSLGAARSQPPTEAEEMAAFANRLRLARVAVGWSQPACAFVAGVEAWTWSRWETGDRPPKALPLARWCVYTGVSLDYLLSDVMDGRMSQALLDRLARSDAVEMLATPLIKPPARPTFREQLD